MASGKKNYFRHSFNARNDDFVMELMERFNEKGYFMWFALVEICAEMVCDGHAQPVKINHSRLVRELKCFGTTLEVFRNQCQTSSKVVWNQLGTTHEIEIINLPKYIGKYSENAPNKRKEKERKEKEIGSTPAAVVAPEVGPKKNLPKKQSQENPKTAEVINTNLFQAEPMLAIEEVAVSDSARTVLTLLNAILFTNFRPTAKNYAIINARLNEGFVLTDFEKVFKHKLADWGNNPKMRKYLRLETLLSNKFDGYLQEAENADKPLVDPLDAFFEKYAPANQASVS